jgi:outer membrane protein
MIGNGYIVRSTLLDSQEDRMRPFPRSLWHRLAPAVAGAIGCAPALAVPGLGSDLIPNFVGVGVGSTSQYSGSTHSVIGVLPGARYKFEGSERFVEWYGPLADVNVLDSREWQFGPALNLRFGRSNVDDPVVARLPEVDNTIEGGLALSYTYIQHGDIPWRLRVGGVALVDLRDTFHGFDDTVYASLWVPLSHTMILGVGTGASWGSASYQQAYYGVTEAGSQASGLPVYTPGGGMRQWYAWPALVVRVAPKWFVGAAAFYQRLTGDVAASPIVQQRGDPNQWTVGVGLGYAF